MKNRKLFTFIALMFCACMAIAQHENCNHGDAPDASLQSKISDFVQVDEMSSHAINLKTAKAEAKNINKIVTAIGKIENIPSHVFAVSSRIAGRIAELYVSPDMRIKRGDPVCKIESLLPGNPPPSIILKSPSDGIVESLNAVSGSPVEPNVEIARIADVSKLYAAASVFERDIGKLKLGASARIKLEAFKDKTFTGRLVKFGSKISDGENTLPVYFELENPGGIIKNGMRGIFYITEVSESAALTVPRSAVIGDSGRKFVFVEKCPEDKIYEKRLVIAGRMDDQNIEVLHGINAGETVATSGVYQLQFMPPADLDSHGHYHRDSDLELSKEKAETESPEAAPQSDSHINTESSEKSPKVKNAGDSPKKAGLNGNAWEKLKISGYFNYLPYAILAASILLNVVFAAAYARNNKKD